MKLRPTCSARRALRSYLTAVTFRRHFSAPHKIIRLLNKRGLRSGGDGWSCVGCEGAWLKSRCRKVVCRDGQRSVTRPIREYEGEIFTDYYFGEANTANKSDNFHNNAINENLNWGGISGLFQRVPGAAQGGAAPPALLAGWGWPSSAPLAILEASVA